MGGCKKYIDLKSTSSSQDKKTLKRDRGDRKIQCKDQGDNDRSEKGLKKFELDKSEQRSNRNYTKTKGIDSLDIE